MGTGSQSPGYGRRRAEPEPSSRKPKTKKARRRTVAAEPVGSGGGGRGVHRDTLDAPDNQGPNEWEKARPETGLNPAVRVRGAGAATGHPCPETCTRQREREEERARPRQIPPPAWAQATLLLACPRDEGGPRPRGGGRDVPGVQSFSTELRAETLRGERSERSKDNGLPRLGRFRLARGIVTRMPPVSILPAGRYDGNPLACVPRGARHGVLLALRRAGEGRSRAASVFASRSRRRSSISSGTGAQSWVRSRGGEGWGARRVPERGD